MTKLFMPARDYNKEVFDYLSKLSFCVASDGTPDEEATKSEIEKIVAKAPKLFYKLKLKNVQSTIEYLKEVYGELPTVLKIISKSITPLNIPSKTLTRTFDFYSIYGQEYVDAFQESPSIILSSPTKYIKLKNALIPVLGEEATEKYLSSFSKVKWALFNTSTKYDLADINNVFLKEFSQEDVQTIILRSNYLYNHSADFYIQLFSQLKTLTNDQQLDFKTKLLNRPDSILLIQESSTTRLSRRKNPTGKERNRDKIGGENVLSEQINGEYSEETINKSKYEEEEARKVIESYLKKSKLQCKFLDEEFKGLLKNYRQLVAPETIGQHMEFITILHESFNFDLDDLKALTILRACGQAKKVLDDHKKNVITRKGQYRPKALLKAFSQNATNDVVLKLLPSASKKLAARLTIERGDYVHCCVVLDTIGHHIHQLLLSKPELADAFPEIKKEFICKDRQNQQEIPVIVDKNTYFKENAELHHCAKHLLYSKRRELESYDQRIFEANENNDFVQAQNIKQESDETEKDLRILEYYTTKERA